MAIAMKHSASNGEAKTKQAVKVPDKPNMARQYTVIIPTLNAADRIERLIETLLMQSVLPEEIVVVDSQSEDGTLERAQSYERVRTATVERNTFDHGGTRDMAIRACDVPFVVLLTQDALPMDAHCMESLLSAFDDETVAAACGRQIAYPDAREAEKLVRSFRYPDESRVWSAEDIPKLGIRAYLLSDVCAAYRRSAYEKVGGFEHPILTNEDMLIAADFLRAGYRLAYCSEARVWHSHNNTLQQEYERNRKIGRFLARYGDRFSDSGELGEGARMVREISIGLLKRGKIGEWIAFGANCAARMLGNFAGKRQEKAHE